MKAAAFHSEEAESQFNFVNEVVHAARSLTVDYNVRSNATSKYKSFRKTSSDSHEYPSIVYLHGQTAEIEKLLRSETQAVVTLVKAAKHVTALGRADPVPAGCAVYPVNETCLVYLLLKGVVNFDEEIVKLENKLGKVRTNLAQLCEKTINKEDYVEKVKAEVREANDQKVRFLFIKRLRDSCSPSSLDQIARG